MGCATSAQDEGTSPHEDRLERELSHRMTELPENNPKGWLGEKGFDLRKVDDFAPDLNAGISQEVDTPVVWLAVVLGYLVFFVPGFVILWRSKRISTKTKSLMSAIGIVGMIAFAVMVYLRH